MTYSYEPLDEENPTFSDNVCCCRCRKPETLDDEDRKYLIESVVRISGAIFIVFMTLGGIFMTVASSGSALFIVGAILFAFFPALIIIGAIIAFIIISYRTMFIYLLFDVYL